MTPNGAKMGLNAVAITDVEAIPPTLACDAIAM